MSAFGQPPQRTPRKPPHHIEPLNGERRDSKPTGSAAAGGKKNSARKKTTEPEEFSFKPQINRKKYKDGGLPEKQIREATKTEDFSKIPAPPQSGTDSSPRNKKAVTAGADDVAPAEQAAVSRPANPFYDSSTATQVPAQQPKPEEDEVAGRCFFCQGLVYLQEAHAEFKFHGKVHVRCLRDVRHDPKTEPSSKSGRDKARNPDSPYTVPSLQVSPAQEDEIDDELEGPAEDVVSKPPRLCVSCQEPVADSEDHFSVRNKGVLHLKCKDDWKKKKKNEKKSRRPLEPHYPSPQSVAGDTSADKADEVGRCFFCREIVLAKDHHFNYEGHGPAHKRCANDISYDPDREHDTGKRRDAQSPYQVPSVDTEEDPATADLPKGKRPSDAGAAGKCIVCNKKVQKKDDHFSVRNKGLLHTACVDKFKSSPIAKGNEQGLCTHCSKPVYDSEDHLQIAVGEDANEVQLLHARCKEAAEKDLQAKSKQQQQEKVVCAYCKKEIQGAFQDVTIRGETKPVHNECVNSYKKAVAPPVIPFFPTPTPVPGVKGNEQDTVGRCIFCREMILKKENHSHYKGHGLAHQRCTDDINADPRDEEADDAAVGDDATNPRPRDPKNPYNVGGDSAAPTGNNNNNKRGPPAPKVVGTCIHCKEKVLKKDDHYSVRGKGPLHVKCKDDFQKSPLANAEEQGPCVHCKVMIYNTDDHLVLKKDDGDGGKEGEASGGEKLLLHQKCQEAFQASSAVKCDHCGKPMVGGYSTLKMPSSGGGDPITYNLHKECVEEFKSMKTKSSAPKCDHCHAPMVDGYVELELGDKKVSLHQDCVEPWQTANGVAVGEDTEGAPAGNCDHCGKPFEGGYVQLELGDATANLHEDCAEPWEAEQRKKLEHS